MNSVFIPNVFGVNAAILKEVMESYFGKVSDIILMLNSKDEMQAFVHFQSWHDREIVYKAIKTMEQGKAWKLRIPEKEETIVLLKNKCKKEVKPVLNAETKRKMLLKILHPYDSPNSDHSGSKAPRGVPNAAMELVDISYVEKIEKELKNARTRIAELESKLKKTNFRKKVQSPKPSSPLYGLEEGEVDQAELRFQEILANSKKEKLQLQHPDLIASKFDR